MAAHQKKVKDLHGCLAFTDESGFLVAPLLRSTLAPQGHTPILRQFGRYRHRVSVAGALVLHRSGHLSLYYQNYPELNVTGERYARFIHDLLWHVRGPLVLLHDGLKIHQGPDMTTLQQRFPRLHPRLLPPYAPELNPVEYLWADSKSQALDRTQPLLPLAENLPETRTHDYVRNGTTTLFAALNTLDGTVIHTCMPRHRHQEWIKFLKLIGAQTPPGKQLHLIVDNYATHKHPKVKAWFKRHPRFHMHFTPTSSSWLNMVERFFRDLTVNRIRRGTFGSVGELIQAIEQYLQASNQNPKPFVWTAKAKDILAKVSRARRRLDRLASE